MTKLWPSSPWRDLAGKMGYDYMAEHEVIEDKWERVQKESRFRLAIRILK